MTRIPSFKGRYLPVFAAEIYDGNARLVEKGVTPVNLKSILIGKLSLGRCTSACLMCCGQETGQRATSSELDSSFVIYQS